MWELASILNFLNVSFENIVFLLFIGFVMHSFSVSKVFVVVAAV